MSAALYEYEMEASPEYECEYECEGEFEGEYETEEFFRRLASWARTQWGTRGSPLRRVALGAGRAALTGGGGVLGTLAGGGPGLGTVAGTTLGGAAAGLLPEPELEGEFEWEAEVNPLRRVYPDALMEHLGHAATESESEAEAEAFLGALIPLAARLVPRVAPAIMRAAPRLIRGVTRVARTLRRSPATRPLVRTIPTIVRRTAASIARQTAAGRPVTPAAAVRTLAGQTARVLNSPSQCVRAYQRSRVQDRRFHRTARRGCQSGCR